MLPIVPSLVLVRVYLLNGAIDFPKNRSPLESAAEHKNNRRRRRFVHTKFHPKLSRFVIGNKRKPHPVTTPVQPVEQSRQYLGISVVRACPRRGCNLQSVATTTTTMSISGPGHVRAERRR